MGQRQRENLALLRVVLAALLDADHLATDEALRVFLPETGSLTQLPIRAVVARPALVCNKQTSQLYQLALACVHIGTKYTVL